MFDFPVLLGDIGGTNSRFAVLTRPTDPPAILPRSLTAACPSPVEAIRGALKGQNGPAPRSALIAVATRVAAPVVRLTNAAWTIDAAEIGSALGLSRVALVNDYAPVAASLLSLPARAGRLARLGPDLPPGPGAKLVLGPGTGLGAAALLPFGDRVALQTSEAGHVDFGPADATEAALWAIIAREGRRVTAETLLSGPGLLRLYRACVERSGAPGPCSTPDEVRQAALAGTDDLAIEALRHFSRVLGRFAGDLALIFGADGGVFIGSGIAPTMADFLAASDFRRAFEDKAPYRALMAAIPTFVIMDPEPALTGLCGIAASPDRYIFDSQIWSVDKSEPASPPA